MPTEANNSLGVFRKVVTSAGTAVAISSTSIPCRSVTLTALETNSGTVVAGGSGVVAALGTTGATGTRKGTPLAAGDSVTFAVHDLADVFIDSTVSAEGVSGTYEVA